MIAALQCEPVSPKGTQEGEEYLPSNSHLAEATPWWAQGSSGCGKNIGCWPRIAEMHMKGVGSGSPDSCIFLYMEECEIP